MMLTGSKNDILKRKLIVTLTGLFLLAFVFKFGWSWLQNDIDPKVSQIEIQKLKFYIVHECIRTEESNLHKGNNLDEDIEWFKNKAPDYCKCVSQKVYGIAAQDQSFKELIERKKVDQYKGQVLKIMKSENARDIADFCLTKAQRYTANPSRMTASQSVSHPTTLPPSK